MKYIKQNIIMNKIILNIISLSIYMNILWNKYFRKNTIKKKKKF